MLVTPFFLSSPRPDAPDLVNGVLGVGFGGMGGALETLLPLPPSGDSKALGSVGTTTVEGGGPSMATDHTWRRGRGFSV